MIQNQSTVPLSPSLETFSLRSKDFFTKRLSGDGIYDGNNNYVKPNNSILNNVFRVTDCPALFTDEIVTLGTKLDQSQSSSVSGNTIDCRVNVTNPSSFTQTFNCNINSGSSSVLTASQILDIEYAIRVANNDVEYSEYIEGARRLDEEMVMNWLENNTAARDSITILNAYYLSQNADIVGQVNNVDRQISLLSDSTLRSNSAAWVSAYNLADTLNNELGGMEVFEQNAKRMNKLYLNTLLYSTATLDEEDNADIEALAFTCPYVGGNAVFRARVLHGMKHFGVHYDDLELCNGQGVYKNGISKLQEQLIALANYNPNAITSGRVINEDNVYVYPNPATNYVTLGCKEAKVFVLSDLLGNVIFTRQVGRNLQENRIEINPLPAGVYIYRVQRVDNSTYNGKLIIE